VSTAEVSSFLNTWRSAGAEGVAGVAGWLAGLTAAVPLGLPGVPGSFQLERGGGGQLLAGEELPEAEAGLGGAAALPGPPAGPDRRCVQVIDATSTGQLAGAGGDAAQDRRDAGEAGDDVRSGGPVTSRAQPTQADSP
jgi:hypothetical protein